MSTLMVDTFTLLGRAEEQYENAILMIEEVQADLRTFRIDVSQMLNTSSGILVNAVFQRLVTVNSCTLL